MTVTWGPRPVVCVLGPTAGARHGRPLELGSVRGRRLLAYLALRAGEHPTRDEALEVVWPGGPPRTAPKSLANMVHRLRGQLGEDAVVWHGSGYRLDPAQVDLDHRDFESEARRATVVLAAGQPALAVHHARHALARWRGRPWCDLEHVDDAVFDRERLVELHTGLHEVLAEATLATGSTHEAVAMAQELTASHPFRERAWWVLALGLHRDRRRRHSLATLQRARSTLAEVGLDPGPELRDLESRVVADDPVLCDDAVFGWGPLLLPVSSTPLVTLPAPSPVLVAGLRW